MTPRLTGAILTVALAVAGCNPTPTTPPDCAGGRVVQQKSGPACAMPTADAGRACTSSDQCLGLCLKTGQCSPFDRNPGCTEILENGRQVTLCID